MPIFYTHIEFLHTLDHLLTVKSDALVLCSTILIRANMIKRYSDQISTSSSFFHAGSTIHRTFSSSLPVFSKYCTENGGTKTD